MAKTLETCCVSPACKFCTLAFFDNNTEDGFLWDLEFRNDSVFQTRLVERGAKRNTTCPKYDYDLTAVFSQKFAHCGP